MCLNLDYIKPSLLSETQLLYQGDNIIRRPLKIRMLKHSVIESGKGIFLEDGSHLDESYLHLHHPACSSLKHSKVETNIPEAVYIGMFINIWGHCLTDCIKHLWPILNDDSRFKELPLLWVPTTPGITMFDSFWKLLEYMGIDRSHIQEVTVTTSVEKLWIPDQCFFPDENNYQRYCTPEYCDLFDRITKNLQPSEQYDKVYFTRSALKQHNRDFGETNIEKVFRIKGYSIISPEQLSFEEQLRILIGCNEFACTDGSIAHNAVFLNKGTKCTFIRKADTVNSYQAPINQIQDLDVTIIDANWSHFLYKKNAPWDGPFFIYNNSRLRHWSGIWTPFPVAEFFKYFFHYAYAWLKGKRMLIKNKN